jgi:hypothetical protein
VGKGGAVPRAKAASSRFGGSSVLAGTPSSARAYSALVRREARGCRTCSGWVSEGWSVEVRAFLQSPDMECNTSSPRPKFAGWLSFLWPGTAPSVTKGFFDASVADNRAQRAANPPNRVSYRSKARSRGGPDSLGTAKPMPESNNLERSPAFFLNRPTPYTTKVAIYSAKKDRFRAALQSINGK